MNHSTAAALRRPLTMPDNVRELVPSNLTKLGHRPTSTSEPHPSVSQRNSSTLLTTRDSTQPAAEGAAEPVNTSDSDCPRPGPQIGTLLVPLGAALLESDKLDWCLEATPR